jgi:thioredoxin-like negative regulator of GroEL
MSAGRERGNVSRIHRGTASLRAPLAPSREAGAPALPADRLPLRLTMSRGLLGLELDAPHAFGPLRITELAISLPGVRFPVDVSGGVARFRHRRGVLTHLLVEAATQDVIGWAAPRLRGLLGEPTPELILAPIEGGFLVGVRHGAAALAFDAIVAPLDDELRVLPERARGLGLGAPPQVLALRALAALCAPFGRISGGALRISGAAAQLARHLLPSAGARAPTAAGIRWSAPIAEIGRFSIEARADLAPPAFTDRALRALELAELCAEADQPAFAGDLESARRLYLALLERAPRHPEIAQRIAWIDALSGGRAEGALSTLVDALPAIDAGVLGGQLLAAVGDGDGARTALVRGAHAEPYGALAALIWLEVARLASELDERLDALDHAVTRSPSLDQARWARLAARLDLADLRGAKADVDHLEAGARGPEARHAVFRRAAEAFLARGFVAESSSLFERALRYAPDDIDAVTGLARSLRTAGQERRSLDLFARAVALAARAGKPAPAAQIELARALAEIAGDRPAAVARVRAVPVGLPESFEARFLEGRWRAELGDHAGASLAFGRLRDAVELAPSFEPDRAAAVAALLVEAAAIEERERDDLHAAQRLLGLALRLRPRDRSIGTAFRRVAAEVARPAPAAPEPAIEAPDSAPPVPHPPTLPAPADVDQAPEPLEIAPFRAPIDFGEAEGEGPDQAEDEALAEQLGDRLRADPADHETAMALAEVLTRLGRDLDLLGLLSARIEEGDDDVRREVAPLRREVLLRLAQAAREKGRRSEAELYESMADADLG